MLDSVNNTGSQTTNSSSPQWLSWDENVFKQSFNQKPFEIEHQLSDHPLFKMERLLELVKTQPESHIEYNAGNVPVSVSHDKTPLNGLSPEETVRRIAECQSWLVIKYVENDPEYKALLEQCLEQIRPLTEPIASGMMKPHAFVFITSPGSITPYHIDPEHNFLLQIRGEKTIRLYDGSSPEILSQQELEDFYCDRGRNLVMDEKNRERCWTFQLPAGKGLHFPVTYPHWVENNDEISISFSITFRTPDLDRRRALYRTNSAIRKFGFQPQLLGKNKMRDNFCYQAFRTWRKVNRLFGKEV